MSDTNMNSILKRWNFRLIGNDGHLLTDGEPQQPPDEQADEGTREIAQKILTMPDVTL